MIKNIIFDMGNVLLRYDPFVSLNMFCETDEAKEMIYRELFCSKEWILGDLGLMSNEERLASVSKRIPEKYYDALEKCVYNWDICMKPLAGAKEFCDYAKEKGYRLFILSNAATDFYSYFTREYDLDFFDGHVVSCDVGVIKPDEKIYRILLDKYDLKAEECFFIDDVEENITGAKKVGIDGIVFNGDYEALRKIL